MLHMLEDRESGQYGLYLFFSKTEKYQLIFFGRDLSCSNKSHTHLCIIILLFIDFILRASKYMYLNLIQFNLIQCILIFPNYILEKFIQNINSLLYKKLNAKPQLYFC